MYNVFEKKNMLKECKKVIESENVDSQIKRAPRAKGILMSTLLIIDMHDN